MAGNSGFIRYTQAEQQFPVSDGAGEAGSITGSAFIPSKLSPAILEVESRTKC